MSMPLAATLAVALALPLVPAHAGESAAYNVTPTCSVVAGAPTDHDRYTFLVVAHATSKSTLSVPVSTTIRCVVRGAGNESTYWTGSLSLPGAASAIAGTFAAYPDIVTCASASATFADGQVIETPAC